jgi:hypothetical protein
VFVARNRSGRRGWTKETLKAGMQLVLEGYRSRDGTRKMTAMTVVLPDGSKLFGINPGTGAPEQPPTK